MERHAVDVRETLAEFREASARRHDTSSQEYHFDNSVPNCSPVQKRFSIHNWNPGPRRGKEGVPCRPKRLPTFFFEGLITEFGNNYRNRVFPWGLFLNLVIITDRFFPRGAIFESGKKYLKPVLFPGVPFLSQVKNNGHWLRRVYSLYLYIF